MASRLEETRWNDTKLRALQPEAQRYEVSIPGHPLWLVVGITGKKTWVWRGRIGGKSVRRNIGEFPAIGLTAAGVEAGKLKMGAKQEASERPAALKQKASGLTVDAAYVLYMDDEGAAKRTGHELQRLYDSEWKAKIGKTKLRDLTTETIREMVEAKAKANMSGVMGNRMLSQLGRFLSWCVEKGHLAASPAKGVSKPQEEEDRNLALSEDQLSILIATLPEAKEFAPAFEFAMRALARVGNVLKMRWSMIDFEREIVTFPTTKNKHPHRCPLTAQMAALLPKKPEDAKANDYVWPFFDPKQPKGYHSWRKRWRDKSVTVAEKQGLTVEEYQHDADEDKVYEFVSDWRIHDFRGTGTSWLCDGDEDEIYNIHVIWAILGHLPKTVAERNYLKNRFIKTRRKAAQDWGNYLDSLKEDGEKAD